jgi:hypothetical protein
VRIDGIDGPEKGRKGVPGQSYGQQARQHLLEIAKGRTAVVTIRKSLSKLTTCNALARPKHLNTYLGTPDAVTLALQRRIATIGRRSVGLLAFEAIGEY